MVCLQGTASIDVEETTWFCIPAGCSESGRDPFQHVKPFTAPNESSEALFHGFLGDVGPRPNYSCIVGLCPSTDAFCACLSSSTDRERPPGPSVNASRDGSPHSSVSASKVSCARRETRGRLSNRCAHHNTPFICLNNNTCDVPVMARIYQSCLNFPSFFFMHLQNLLVWGFVINAFNKNAVKTKGRCFIVPPTFYNVYSN